ncbi:uncharacterized protein LOC126704910 [Quercus robur]|uniref:uncharacterized protein LOC126704910 n=1 Tax=Quercus robur TaxID=38942 RepID=UPI002162707A|nr:uncharacterized protein LOC126704910 [Quercus robur]
MASFSRHKKICRTSQSSSESSALDPSDSEKSDSSNSSDLGDDEGKKEEEKVEDKKDEEEMEERVRNFGESGAQQVDVPPIFQGDWTLKLPTKAKLSGTGRKKSAKVSSVKKPKTQTKTKVIPSTQKAFVQEMTFDEEIESNVEMGDSNRAYAKNSQDKEDLKEATSKDQESESTKTNFDPLLSLLYLDLKATCF